jgi:hypothetical protein
MGFMAKKSVRFEAIEFEMPISDLKTGFRVLISFNS